LPGVKRGNSLKTIWFFLKPYKFSFLFLLVLGILIGVFETLHIGVLYPILNGTLEIQSGQDSNFFISFLGSLANIIPIDDIVIANSIIFILLTVLFFIFRTAYLSFSLRITSKIVIENKLRVFQKYVKSDYQFFIDNKQGELLYKATAAPSSIAILLEQLTRFFVEAILSVSILVLLFSLSWTGAIAVIIIGIGYYYFSRYLGTKVSYFAGTVKRETSERENVVLTEYITGTKSIRVFETSSYWRAEFEKAVNRFWQFWKRSNFWRETAANLINLALFSVVAIIVVIIKIQNPVDFVSMIPVFGTFAFAIFKLLPRLSGFGTYQMQIMNALPNVEVVQEVLQDTTYNKIKNGNEVLSELRTGLEFRDVKFVHKKREATLADVSLKIEKDKMTAIVGPSGTGKSTIVDLLLRLYDVNEGGIYVDDKNIKEYNISSLLTKFGFIGQETFIFNASVKDNIKFGDGYSMSEVTEAATLANADEFIRQLPEGYDTLVGDRGVRLSGGEKQRIAIARAMIRKPEMLILDEATSSLDSISESVVQDAISKVSEKCTTLIIAHRLRTIRNADIIYVLNQGTVVESGTHQQLIEQKGRYWQLYDIQEK